MVVRPEVLHERIAILRDAVARLTILRQRDLSDPIVQWAVERGLHVASEAVFDLGNHVLSGAFRTRATDYAEVPVLLARHAVIPAALEERLRGLAGFRNLLVHDYARVDPGKLEEILAARLGDFEDFARAIEAWLPNRDAGGA